MAAPIAEREASFQRGLETYRAGHYYEAHEHWEVIWRDEESPIQKAFLQGLILVAAAMHKLEKMRSPAGAARLMANAAARLAGVPDGTGSLAIARLRDDIERARVAIERLAAEGGEPKLPEELVPRMERLCGWSVFSEPPARRES
jgi:predicted metal-dependent hydrolase